MWSTRKERGLSRLFLADLALTTPDVLQKLESGGCDPGLRIARDLDRALNAGGELWNSWASAHLAALFHSDRPPTITDALREAFQIRAYAPLVLPDPYLIGPYAAALHRLEAPMNLPLSTDVHVEAAGRLHPTTSTTSHCLVVDETALARHLAPAEVLRAQLLHLHHLAQHDRITVHLIPATTGPHPGLRGAFWTLCYSPARSLVYTPHPCGTGHFHHESATVKAHTDLFATLQGVALPAEDSLHRIAELAARLTTRPRQALTDH
ncbi:Scr1 family TA system antitoxin-like transcriptional regulator [Nocardiopsis sp. NPDC055879]